MMRGLWRLLPLLAIGLAACAPGGPERSLDRGQATVASPPRTLRIVARVEADDLIHEAGPAKTSMPFRLFTAGLTAIDHRETPYPVLADSLPQLNSDTWKVFPDGKMETIHRLRLGLMWHDGTTLTAEDFAFALRAFKAEVDWGYAPGSATVIGTYMDAITVLEPQVLTIQWGRPYPEAAAPQFLPLPRHLLERSLDLNDRDAYWGLNHWRNAYVGAGPYRLERWERGAFMEGAAFDGYALGRPKIERIVLTFGSNPSVTVARLLSGDLDVAVDQAIELQEVVALRQDWVPRAQGRIVLSPVQLRYIQVQSRAAYANPRALLDVGVRAALLHAIDRPALAEAMVEDRTMAADAMVPPTVGYFSAVDRAITKYPFDVRRTEQLMAAAGFTRGNDDIFVSPGEGRFSAELGGISEGQAAQDSTIVADYLKRAGIEARLNLVPASLRSGIGSDELNATFPGLNTNNNSLNPPMLGLHKFTSATIGTPQNNWRGNNVLGWSHPEYDRLVSVFNGTLEPREADALMVQLLALLSRELPTLPLYFNFLVVAHVRDLNGPEPFAPRTTYHHNVHQWEWK